MKKTNEDIDIRLQFQITFKKLVIYLQKSINYLDINFIKIAFIPLIKKWE